MSFDSHTNLAYSTVATAPSPATSGTSLVVAAGQGALFPTAPFNATLFPPGVQPTTLNSEIVRVTAVSTDTLTIVRAQESTTAQAVAVNFQIMAGVTKKTLTDIEAATVITTILASVYPVGSVYVNAAVSTNPATLLGFGTWVNIGTGQVLVGFETSDSNFGTLGQTGGEVTHTLTTPEIPSHTHVQRGTFNTTPQGNMSPLINATTLTETNSNTVTVATGGGGAHNNLQPYVVVFMWQRTV